MEERKRERRKTTDNVVAAFPLPPPPTPAAAAAARQVDEGNMVYLTPEKEGEEVELMNIAQIEMERREEDEDEDEEEDEEREGEEDDEEEEEEAAALQGDDPASPNASLADAGSQAMREGAKMMLLMGVGVETQEPEGEASMEEEEREGEGSWRGGTNMTPTYHSSSWLREGEGGKEDEVEEEGEDPWIEIKLVEVKSKNDFLSDHQLAWIDRFVKDERRRGRRRKGGREGRVEGPPPCRSFELCHVRSLDRPVEGKEGGKQW
eukprot:evm.model.NODE_36132_length_15106_cov_15.923143.3